MPEVRREDQQESGPEQREFREGDRTALVFGALLHDVGKVVQRGWSSQGKHQGLGASFLSDEVAARNADYEGPIGKQVIEQVRLHHARDLKGAGVGDSSLAYVTYFADNVSAMIDRKSRDADAPPAFDRDVDMRRIFNILNGHDDDNVIRHGDYNAIRARILDNLASLPLDWRHVNSAIDLLEATTDKVPSSTDRNQLVDVSLFDHAKTTAAIATCIYDYLFERGTQDFRSALFAASASERYYDEPMFLLSSLDMSGIQAFIYNISGDGALKQLRARSMYLELLLEHIMDELLGSLRLSRANLLYTGGGHAYLLLPNTAYAKNRLAAFKEELDEWFVRGYRTDLYLAAAYTPCSANDLSNRDGEGERYRNLFRRLSEALSQEKLTRYDATTIAMLNYPEGEEFDHSRECTECHRSDLAIDADGKCAICAELGRISNDLVHRDVFVVAEGQSGLPLPFDAHLDMYTVDEYRGLAPEARRVYVKNDWMTGISLATHIWMGDYTAIPQTPSRSADAASPAASGRAGKGVLIADYAKHGVTLPCNPEGVETGIERLGVLRADVDNLGTAFVSGIPARLTSISRTATLSRSISFFFKSRINDVLAAGGYQLQVIYSGGDDLFVMGNWSDVIHAAIDLKAAFDGFTGNGSLTISAGIGMYDAKYPISRMAAETGDLVDAAKLHRSPDGKLAKNAVALWSEGVVFGWDEFVGSVAPLHERMHALFDGNEKGKAFIYRIIHLIRDLDEPISAPRLAYLLARSFEDLEDGDAIGQELYRLASDADGRRNLTAALEWYVYETRERG